MGQSTTPKALALGVSLSLACGLLPGAAFAEEAPADDESSGTADAAPSGDAAKPAGYDKADFYSDGSSASIARSLAAPLSRSSFGPMSLSDNMKYFARFESGQNYDQGLSWGDGYHAMGYYQFDNRYALKSFLMACYNYNPTTYSMFGWVANTDISGDLYDWDAGELTEVGKRLNDSWHTAYAYNPTEFAGLQDSYAYENYYAPAENYLASRGIDIANRSDSVKSLCWGLANLFGTSGWHKFVGGWSDGYVNGTYYNSYDYPGAGLTNDMTDEEFVTVLCDYVVAHVGEFYQGQPQYHEGWENRYRNEKAAYLDILGQTAGKPEPPAAEEPQDPEDTTPPADNGTLPPDNTAPPTDNGNPPNEPEDKPSNEPQEPEDTTPPADNGTDQNGSSDVVKPNDKEDGTTVPPAENTKPSEDAKPPASTTPPEETAPETAKPSEKPTAPETETATGPTASATNEPTQEVVDKEQTSLEEPSTANSEPRDLPKSDGAAQANEEEQASGAAKTSSLTQTGDDTLKGPLGAALASAGVAAIAGAALATRRILK